jgi:hypothetical protein
VIAQYREKLNRLFQKQNFLADDLRTEQNCLVAVEDDLMFAEEAQQIIQLVSVAIQQEAHDKIASVVSRCLEAIFDEPYEFKINFERKRGKTEAVLTFVRGGMTLTDPLNEAGGGVIDVAAFALRLACLVLERPVRRRLLVLDEPFSGIRGAVYRQRMRGLVETLASEFDVQFILNIDADVYPEFMLGNVIELG